jgi:hypothetical protein
MNPSLKPLETEFLVNKTQKFGPYLTGNSSLLRYRDKPVNVV